MVSYMHLVGWKSRRQDKRTEEYWRKKELEGLLNDWQLYQKEWNFIETEYGIEDMGNGYTRDSPAFAYQTKYVKYLVHKKARIKNGKIIKVWRQGEEEPEKNHYD